MQVQTRDFLGTSSHLQLDGGRRHEYTTLAVFHVNPKKQKEAETFVISIS